MQFWGVWHECVNSHAPLYKYPKKTPDHLIFQVSDYTSKMSKVLERKKSVPNCHLWL